MSIPGLESVEVPASHAEQELDTRLIAGMLSDFFHAGPNRTPEFPSTVPTTLAGVPAHLPGSPQTIPTSPDLRASGLNGGFEPNSTAQPVHPEVVGAENQLEVPAAQAAPSSLKNDALPFGEPSYTAGFLKLPASDYPVSHGLDGLVPHTARTDSLVGSDFGRFYFLDESVHPAPLATPPLSAFDVEAVRRDFPALHQRVNGHPLIFLDNASTTHKPRAVLDATSQFYGRDNSNIHRAAHVLAERSTKLFEASREKVRQFLGASDAKEIVFLRGTTEGINLIANSYGRSHVRPGDEILLTRLEHHANIVPWQLLAQQTGATIRVVPLDDRGQLIMEEFSKLLSEKTKIVSVAHVSNALGTINPLEQIIPMAHAVGAVVVVDGAQSTPHLPVNVTALNADFFVFSGHKIFGPTGIGALYGKKHLLEKMPPWQGGGHMIQDVTFEKTQYRAAPEKFEAGTPDIAGVIGLGAVIDYLFRVGIPSLAAYEHTLLEYGTQALSTIPGLRLIGTAEQKASILSFVIPGIPNEAIAIHLDKEGIAVRAGHHCAMPAQRHFGLETTVRPSLAFYNTYAEIDVLVSALRSLPKT